MIRQQGYYAANQGPVRQGGAHMSGDGHSSDRTFQMVGWLLFTISACFFVISSLQSRNWTGLAGGLFFLIACIVFMVSYLRR